MKRRNCNADDDAATWRPYSMYKFVVGVLLPVERIEINDICDGFNGMDLF